MRSIAESSAFPADFLLGLIRLYQVHISPYKGFSCAHRVVHGGRSCSAHAAHILKRFGTGPLLPLLLRRRDECRDAALLLASDKQQAIRDFDANREGRRDCWANHCSPVDACDIGDLAGGCLEGVCSAADCCDVS
jgi:putative component of membrane protein insertase Oxa1/YidC/SpoIIIJ protein YidD